MLSDNISGNLYVCELDFRRYKTHVSQRPFAPFELNRDDNRTFSFISAFKLLRFLRKALIMRSCDHFTIYNTVPVSVCVEITQTLNSSFRFSGVPRKFGKCNIFVVKKICSSPFLFFLCFK